MIEFLQRKLDEFKIQQDSDASLAQLRENTHIIIRNESPTLEFVFPHNFVYERTFNPVDQKGEKLFEEFKKHLLKFFDKSLHKKIKNQFPALRSLVATVISSGQTYGDYLTFSLYSKGTLPTNKNNYSTQRAEAWVQIDVTNNEDPCMVHVNVYIKGRSGQETANTNLIAVSNWIHVQQLVDDTYQKLTQH